MRKAVSATIAFPRSRVSGAGRPGLRSASDGAVVIDGGETGNLNALKHGADSAETLPP